MKLSDRLFGTLAEVGQIERLWPGGFAGALHVCQMRRDILGKVRQCGQSPQLPGKRVSTLKKARS
ncbi:hypothetical protein [Paracoccus halophilus]|uniref:hypothetical protein n=1 Tax=Paracoccus halophilus TaxID=376733 RepID=UPI0011140BCD|nr:hypothetical protein [Paracoccus halophilus]